MHRLITVIALSILVVAVVISYDVESMQRQTISDLDEAIERQSNTIAMQEKSIAKQREDIREAREAMENLLRADAELKGTATKLNSSCQDLSRMNQQLREAFLYRAAEDALSPCPTVGQDSKLFSK